MPKLVLLTYADANYAKLQAKLCDRARECGEFDDVMAVTRGWLEQTTFYADHRDILDRERGAGYWLWKPYVLLTELERRDEGDVVLYLDSADWLHVTEGLRDCLMGAWWPENILFTKGSYRHGDWTKRDCFVRMLCDFPRFHEAIQLEAGIIAVRNTVRSRAFIRKWLLYCMDPAILTDEPNVCGLPNLDGFRDHRHDQSVLTNLALLFGIPATDVMRGFVICNAVQSDGGAV